MTGTTVSALAPLAVRAADDPGYLMIGAFLTVLLLVLLWSMVLGCARAASSSDRDSERLARGGRR